MVIIISRNYDEIISAWKGVWRRRYKKHREKIRLKPMEKNLFTTSRNKNAVMNHNSFISMHLFDTRTLKLITGRFFSLFLFSLLSCISAMSSLIIVNHFSLYVLGFDPLIQRYEKLCYLSALNFLECSVIVAAAEDVVAMH